MALSNKTTNISSLFQNRAKNLNLTEISSDDVLDLIKEVNIINPESLSRDDLSIILKRLDDYEGFYSTQQLENIDYSLFSNHVFFDSAVNKVSYAFNRIHEIPFDKDEIENLKYKNKTDGYTNYILKNKFPKSKGFANFSGSETIVVFDEQGKILSENKNNKVGLLNPKTSNFSFDFWLYVDGNSLTNNNNQVVFNKIEIFDDGGTKKINNGFLCTLSNIDDNDNNEECFIELIIYIDKEFVSSKTKIKKDVFQNVTISVSSLNNLKKIDFIIDGNIVESSKIISLGSIQNKNFGDGFKDRKINFSIGGIFSNFNNNVFISSEISHDNHTFNNLTGKIDEFRFFHKTRSKKVIKQNMHKNINAQKGLRLYLRLNEPGGNYRNSCLTIDYSGNKLHGVIYQKVNNQINIMTDTSNFKVSNNTPLKLEKIEDSPVLNPSYLESLTVRENLIIEAKKYDSQNPNLIFNLMPRHYFLAASDFQNLPVFSSEDAYNLPASVVNSEGNLVKTNTLNAKVPANNELVNIVLIWARFFDQLKCYISSITNLLNVNYDAINKKQIIGMQIPLLCKMYGLEFREILPTITKNKLNNENLKFEDILSENSIRKIQNILWQRFLINTQDFLRSKGTTKSIQSAFSSFGIDHNKFIDIREYSSNNSINQSKNFNLQNVKKFCIDFGNQINLMIDPVFTGSDYPDNKLFLQIPDIKSKSIDQSKKISNTNTQENGFGENWSIEMFFDFKNMINKKFFLQKKKINQEFESVDSFKDSQFLFRIDNIDDDNLISVKYVRKSSNNTKLGNIVINIKTIHDDNSFNQEIIIQDVDVFSNKKYFSITQSVVNGVVHHSAYIDDIGKKISIKDIKKVDKTKTIQDSSKLFSKQSGLTFKIGDYNYTNQVNFIESDTNPVFQGQVYKVRLWKKSLTINEISSHVKDLDNFGTEDFMPLKHVIADFEVKNIQSTFNQNNNVRTWEIEDITNNLNDQNQSLNKMTLTTKNSSQVDSNVINFNNFLVKNQNIKFDEANSYNKVNIVSLKENKNKTLLENFNSFPSNKVPNDFLYENINRISVDMSIVKIINSDISKIISNVNDFTSKISNTYSKYEYNYQEIESIKKTYFEKFSDSNFINYSSIGNVFKYFDNIMTSILYEIVPSRVRFEGFNLVYESHVLERHKYMYKNKDSINTIIDSSNDINYYRQSIVSRRSSDYNDNRKI